MRNEDEYARFVAAAARHATSFVPCWRDSVVLLSGTGHSSEEEILHDDKIRLEKAQGREDQPKSPLKEWKSKSGLPRLGRRRVPLEGGIGALVANQASSLLPPLVRYVEECKKIFP